MTPEEHERVEELFGVALELPETQWVAFLASVCDREPAIGQELRSLLGAHRQAGSFIETPALGETPPGVLRQLAGAPGASAPTAEVQTAAAPPSQLRRSIGPYRVLERLGRGGMGVVYRAEHVDSGHVVAVKTVQVPARESLSSLRREIHALARIRHPGIVPIVAEGVDEWGLPWYAMELIEGMTLRQYASANVALLETSTRTMTVAQDQPEAKPRTPWWTRSLDARFGTTRVDLLGSGPVPSDGAAVPPQGPRTPKLPPFRDALRRILGVIRRLCGSLAFLHGEGMVHRDLKPENILIRPGGMPVLVDFGLAVQFSGELSRETLESEPLAAGTLAYIAPEQGRAELVDARADLYALGCILYELLTGQPPFVGSSPGVVLRQHFQAAPIPPSQVSAQLRACPEASQLDELVLRLLEKQPRRRPGHADDVDVWLARLGFPSAAPAADAGPKPRAYLYRPGLAGRAEPLARLEAEVHSLEVGPGRLILIGGESGVGKTRLAIETAKAARLGGVSVVLAECAPGSTSALHALRPLLRHVADQCHEHGLEETERLLGTRGPVLALYEPALRVLPGQEARGAAEELPAMAARLRLHRYLAETLEALTSSGVGHGAPVLLVLDDLQWADELSLSFLEHLLRGDVLQRVRVLVLAMYRSEEVGTLPDSPLQRLLDSPGPVRLELGPLDEEGIGSIVSDMLALEPAPVQFSGFLARHSEGNPFFVAEYLRAAVAEGLLYRDAAGTWQVTSPVYESLPLPRSLRELIGRRVDDLGAAGRRLLEASAVLGRELDAAVLEDVGGLEEQEQREAVRELLRRHVLEEPAAGRLRFAHDKLREVAYERLEPVERTRLHRAAAEALVRAEGRASGQAQSGQQQGILGHHWEQAGEPLQARPCYLAAARASAAVSALEAAERYCRAYLRLADAASAERADVHNQLGRILLLRARAAEAYAEHSLALEEARSLGERALEADSLVAMGRVRWSTGLVDEAQTLLQQGLVVSAETGDLRLEARGRASLAILNQERGRLDEARDCYEQALQILQQLGDRRNAAKELGNLGIVEHNLGRSAEAERLYRQALGIHREFGDRLYEGVVLGNLGNLIAESGRLEEAEAIYEQALRIHRDIGNVRHEAIVLGNLAGNVLHRQGRMEKAREVYEQSLRLHREVGNLRHGGNVLGSLAGLENLADEDPPRAEALVREGAAMLGTVGDPLELGKLLLQWGHIALARGSSAQDYVDRARSLADASGVGPEGELRQNITRLQQAQAVFEAGASSRLVRGHLPEHLAEGVRRWLVQTGRLDQDATETQTRPAEPKD